MTAVPASFTPAADSLRDRVILVTGATGGIGEVAAREFARHGASVILLARNLRRVEALYDDIERSGGPTPAIYPMNLEGATEKDYADLADNVEREFGRLDGVLHAAAILGAPTVFEQSDSETWYRVHQVNLHAPYLLTRACLPLLTKAGPGSLVFVVDDKPGAYWDAYQVSKRGLAAMAELLAAEYEGTRLHVNCFAPGPTRTGLQVRAFPAADNERLPPPGAHARALLYLFDPALELNGACLRGGPA